MNKMLKTIYQLSLLVAIASLVAAPLAHAETPAEFLKVMLDGDFAGDSTARFDHVFYSDGRYEDKSDCGCGGARREVFSIDRDSIFVTSRFEIRGWALTSRNRAEVQVRYWIIADSEERNFDRRILPLAVPQMVEVTFKVLRKRGEWLWVDPPEKPYVGWQAAREAMRKQVDGYRDVIKEIENDPADSKWKERIPSLQNHMAKHQRQLEILDSLRPLLPNGQP